MTEEELVRLIAQAIEPVWFWGTEYDPVWGRERHGLDNYPGQHEHHREKATKQAQDVLRALKEAGFAVVNIEKMAEILDKYL